MGKRVAVAERAVGRAVAFSKSQFEWIKDQERNA